MSNSILKNISWNIYEKIVNFLNSIFVIFILTNYFGSFLFGSYSYAISIVSLFSFIAYFGLESIIINEIVKNKYKIGELMGSALLLLTISSLLTFIIICSINYLFVEDRNLSILIFLYSFMVFSAPINVFQLYFNSKINLVEIFKLKIALLIVVLIGKILLVYFDMSIMAFIVLEAFSILALSCISLFFYYYKKNKILFKFSSLIFFDLLKKGLPLMISAGAIVVYGKIDIVLIKHFLDIEMVGIYSVAIKISELWYVVPMSISAILFPLIVNAKNHSENKYLNQVFITSQVMIVVCSLFALILFFLVSNFIEHYLSDEYIGVGPLIKVFALCGPFVGLGYINGGCMVAENLLLFSMKRNIYGMLINIVLNIILIPLYGLYGAAISTLIAVIYTSMISLAFNKKAYKILCTQIRAFFYAANILKFIDNIMLIEKSHKKL